MLAFAHTAVDWIAPTLFVLTLIVTVHELGHFLVARGCGVAIDSFSIGFGRSVLSWRDRSGVNWRVGWIPLGGYVRFAGDENAASVPDAEDLAALRAAIVAAEGPDAVKKYYHFKPIWQRALIAAAGPMANFLLAVVLFTLVLMTVGRQVQPARIDSVVAGSPAAAAGFRPGDLVIQAGGRRIESFDDLQRVVAARAGQPTAFTVRRGGGLAELTATPGRGVVKDQLGRSRPGGMLGLASTPTAADQARHRYPPLQALGAGTALTWDVLQTTVYTIGEIVQGHLSATNLSGPLGIAQASHAVAQAGAEGAHGFGEQIVGGLINLLGFSAVISVGIGFMNLLPIPVLDGGHLLFYAYEAVARRPVGTAVQTVSYRVGLALLLGLMLFATTNDLQRSSVFHFLGGLFS